MDHGDCISFAEQSQQVGPVPAGLEPPRFDAGFGRGVLAQHVQRDPAQHREVLGGMPDPHAAVIFPMRDIQHPIRPILDPPLPAHRSRKRGDLTVQAGQGEGVTRGRGGMVLGSPAFVALCGKQGSFDE